MINKKEVSNKFSREMLEHIRKLGFNPHICDICREIDHLLEEVSK